MASRLVSVLMFLFMTFPASADVSGVPKVLAGDTLQLGDIIIRLEGIKSPPPGQMCENEAGLIYDCGQRARDWLIQAISGKKIICYGNKVLRGGLLHALCYRGAQNLNGAVIRAGWAMTQGRSAYRYLRMQETAAGLKIGLHAGAIINPR